MQYKKGEFINITVSKGDPQMKSEIQLEQTVKNLEHAMGILSAQMEELESNMDKFTKQFEDFEKRIKVLENFANYAKDRLIF